MNKRQRLGQHFLKSKKIAQMISDSAKIKNNETVLEVGTGKGILTEFLCKHAKNVISAESDKALYNNAVETIGDTKNLKLFSGDGFKLDEKFDVFVSNLPYSKSRTAIEWLVQKKFSRAIIMVQKEFAEKLMTEINPERKAISILCSNSFDIKKIISVGKNNFDPPPQVDSVVLELKQKKSISKDVVKTVNKLFSYRRKTIQNILKQFGIKSNDARRLDELTGDEIIKIAKQVIR